MSPSDTQAIAGWIPPTIVVSVLGIAIGAIVLLVKLQISVFIAQLKIDFATFNKRLENMEASIKDQDRAMVSLATSADVDKIKGSLLDMTARLGGFMTTEQGGRLGDRMDGRITNVAERLAVLEATAQRK